MNHLQPGGQPARGQSMTQSTKSGTTYSLGGVAGLLYTDDDTHRNATAQASRQPVKKKALTKQQSTESARSSSTEPSSPHQAISGIVKAAKTKDGYNGRPGDRSSGAVWDHQVREQLRSSNASSGSIDDLLTNVLGRTRSPA